MTKESKDEDNLWIAYWIIMLAVPTGFFRLIEIQDDFSDLFSKPVDIRTPNELSRYFLEEVLKTVEVQYVAR